MNKAKELKKMGEELKELHTKYTGNENQYQSNHTTSNGKLKTNYGFTRPIDCDGSKTYYYQVLRLCYYGGATPEEVFCYIPSHCNRSHFYNSGLVRKDKKVWVVTSYGYEYVKIVEAWEARFKILRSAGL